LEKPLLWNNRKFDLRILVLVNSTGDVFQYDKAYIRLSSNEYDQSDLTDKFIHLTNICLQKYNENFGKYEEGNCLDLDELEGYIRKKYP
jgi:hypothetical protein